MSVSRTSWRYRILLAALTIAFCVPALADDDIFYNAEASLHADDNVSTAWREKDIREDSVFTGAFGASYATQTARSGGIGMRGGLEYHSHADFDKLNALILNAGVDYRFRPGESFFSPTYNLGLTVKEKFSDSEIRDSTTFDLKFDFFVRFTELTSAVFGVGYSVEEAEGVVFDQARARLFGNLDLMLSARDTLFATLIYLDGDVASTGTSDSLELTNAAEVLEPDDAFGDGSVTGPVAYRLDATTIVLSLGYNHVLTKKESLDVSARFLSSAASDADIDYQSLSLRASYLLRFK